jgi:hypothetical protein
MSLICRPQLFDNDWKAYGDPNELTTATVPDQSGSAKTIG